MGNTFNPDFRDSISTLNGDKVCFSRWLFSDSCL